MGSLVPDEHPPPDREQSDLFPALRQRLSRSAVSIYHLHERTVEQEQLTISPLNLSSATAASPLPSSPLLSLSVKTSTSPSIPSASPSTSRLARSTIISLNAGREESSVRFLSRYSARASCGLSRRVVGEAMSVDRRVSWTWIRSSWSSKSRSQLEPVLPDAGTINVPTSACLRASEVPLIFISATAASLPILLMI